jgi:hypothetical protein
MDSDFAEPAAALRAEIAERFEVFFRFHGGWPPAVVGRGRFSAQKDRVYWKSDSCNAVERNRK